MLLRLMRQVDELQDELAEARAELAALRSEVDGHLDGRAHEEHS